MRIAFAVVIAAVLLTSCVRRPGVYVVGGNTAQCVERVRFFCRSPVCIPVRVFDERGVPVENVVVSAWQPDVSFEEESSPEPLWTARTGSQGRVILYLDKVVMPRDGILVSADGRPVGREVLFSDDPVRTVPECLEVVLPPVPQE